MQLSQETISTLKNFAAINPNLVFKPGSTLKTISVAKNILSTASISETIPQEFGIYDLNEFLSVLNMFDKPTLNFTDGGKNLRIYDSDGRRSVNYYFADPSILTTPSKDISMPKCEIKFRLSESDISSILKAASVLGVQEVAVVGEEGDSGVTLKVVDVKNSSSNTLEIHLAEGVTRPDNSFSMVFTISNFKFIPGDYDVSLSSKLISHFKHATVPVEYWVALEKSSQFNS